MHTKIGQTFPTETNGNSTKPLLTAVFYCQMLNFSAFHRFFLIL